MKIPSARGDLSKYEAYDVVRGSCTVEDFLLYRRVSCITTGRFGGKMG